MTALIIPDLHHQVEHADHWLRSQCFARAVFLGDFFDDRNDDVGDARRTAYWLRERMERAPGDVFLLGNHDAAYLRPERAELYCPGFTKAKAKAIGEILGPPHWDRFQLAWEEQGWLLSHAGFHPAWTGAATAAQILARAQEAMAKLGRGEVDRWLCEDRSLPGGQVGGGPLWTRWSDFQPMAGINQIVGHTPHETVQVRYGPQSVSYCLDVGNGAVAALLADGQVRVLETLASSRTTGATA